MNKPATPEVAAPAGRWRALAARCLNPGGITLSSRLRNALFVLFVLFLGGILAYGAGFAWYMLAHLDLIDLIRDLIEDDAFYYFQIASNLAEGKFSTFDGGITRTNGYHPLWLFLITPFYWIFDREAALFAIKAFEIMLVAGGVALVTAAARLARLPWYLMFAALPMLYSLHRALIGGIEAAPFSGNQSKLTVKVKMTGKPHSERRCCNGAGERRDLRDKNKPDRPTAVGPPDGMFGLAVGHLAEFAQTVLTAHPNGGSDA